MGWLMPICSFLGSRMPEILPVSRDVHMSLVTFRSLYFLLFSLNWRRRFVFVYKIKQVIRSPVVLRAGGSDSNKKGK